MKLHRSFTLTTIQSSVEMSILARAGLLLAFVPSIMASTDCEMSGTAWDNDMECTGAGTGLTIPSSQRTLATCVAMGKAGQAGDPNRMCIKATGCSDTDSSDCVCSLHCGCAMGSASGSKSCITKAQVAPKTCDTATCSSGNNLSSAAAGLTSLQAQVAVLISILFFMLQ